MFLSVTPRDGGFPAIRRVRSRLIHSINLLAAQLTLNTSYGEDPFEINRIATGFSRGSIRGFALPKCVEFRAVTSLRILIFSVLASFAAIPAFALPTGNSAEFLVTKWTTEEGLPQNTVTSIVQTTDGYIWLGTFGGLARFDGIRFTTFDGTNTPGFLANRVLSLHPNPNGGLLVGTDSGELYTIKGNRLEEFVSGLDFERKAIWGIEEDSQGHLYVSSPAGIETFPLDAHGWPVPGRGRVLALGEAYRVAKDANGRVWAKIDNEIVLLSPTGVRSITSLGYDLPDGAFDFTFSPEGRLFVAAFETLGELSRSGYREIMRIDPDVHRKGSSIEYAQGKVWYQQFDELFEIDDTTVKMHRLGDQVLQGTRLIFDDKEGNIWLGTQTDGLVRITRKRIESMAEKIGYPLLGLYSVAEAADGTVWFTAHGLSGIKDGQVRTISKVRNGEGFPTLKALAVDDEDRLWAGGASGLYTLEDNELVPVPGFADRNVQCLFFDRSGNLWVGNEGSLMVLRDGRAILVGQNNTLISSSIHFIAQTRRGTIWIGTGKGVAEVNAETMEFISEVKEFAGDYVRAIHETPDGSIWIGTYGRGLKRLKNGKVSTITRANGLPNNFVSRILVANDGKFWILSNFGVFAIAQEELDRVADGSAALLGGAVFGVPDGMTSSEANGGHQPAGVRTADGKLWFPMIDDMVTIDPESLASTAPKILIENALSRTTESPETRLPITFDTSRRLEISDEMRNLEIEYAGLSFTKPESIRYVYMLEGLDTHWTDAGNRRTAFYPYLPPGNYQFLVKAVNANGVWSKTSALQIHVAEKFWETRWFASAVFLAVLGVLALVFLIRVRHLNERQARKAEFAKQLIVAGEKERRRIATELHDGLSQNLLLIKNWARLARQSAEEKVAQSRQYLERIDAVAGESIDETRTIIENLGPQNLTRFGLTEAIINIADQVEDAFGVVFELDVENVDGSLDEENELSLYRMVQECVNNIVKHSESPRGRILISKERSILVLVIADFGKGIRPNGSDGKGLRNLEERAELLGGRIEIDSRPDEGTKVTIRVPCEV